MKPRLNNNSAIHKIFLALCLTVIAPDLIPTTECSFANAETLNSGLENDRRTGGHLFLYEKQDTELKLANCKVTCPSDSAVYVFQTAQAIVIYNFDAPEKKNVELQIGESRIKVPVAHEVLITESEAARFNDVNPKLGILFRVPKLLNSKNGTSVFDAEFMIESAAQQIPGIRELSSSHDSQQQDCLNRILKNAALLQPTAKREFVNRMRIPSIKHQADNGSRTSNFAHSEAILSSSMLQGPVQELEAGNTQLIDLTLKSAERSSEQLHLLAERDGDWTEIDVSDASKKELTGLLVLKQDSILKTELASISCKKGATVFIDNHADELTVCTLDSKLLKDVIVSCNGGQRLRVLPGYAILLCDPKKERITGPEPAHLLAYRSWVLAGFDNLDIYCADFSIANAMYKVAPLRKMAHSTDPDLRARARAILHNAAILAHIDP